MKALEVIRFLLDEVEKEQISLTKYNTDLRNAREQAIINKKSTWDYFKWQGRIPCKSRILHNMRQIRRLSLQVIADA